MRLEELFTRVKRYYPADAEAIEYLDTKLTAAFANIAALLTACGKLKPEGNTLSVLELAAVMGEIFALAKDTYQKSAAAGIVQTFKPFHL